MGKVEKIVVLGVLFVIVLILVVSLDTGLGGRDGVLADGRGGAPPPPAARDLGGPEEEPIAAGVPEHDLDRETPDPDPLPEDEARGGEEGLLVAVQLRTPVYEVPDAIPADWALKTLAGLADHLFDPTHKVYQAREGDTFEALAERFYGERGYAPLLRRVNEGRTTIEAGDELLVPTHDDGLGTAAGPGRAAIPEGARTYVALEGESLWKIAKKMYGKGHLWEGIWEANQDRLDSPDFVPTGIELVIPTR